MYSNQLNNVSLLPAYNFHVNWSSNWEQIQWDSCKDSCFLEMYIAKNIPRWGGSEWLHLKNLGSGQKEKKSVPDIILPRLHINILASLCLLSAAWACTLCSVGIFNFSYHGEETFKNRKKGDIINTQETKFPK